MAKIFALFPDKPGSDFVFPSCSHKLDLREDSTFVVCSEEERTLGFSFFRKSRRVTAKHLFRECSVCFMWEESYPGPEGVVRETLQTFDVQSAFELKKGIRCLFGSGFRKRKRETAALFTRPLEQLMPFWKRSVAEMDLSRVSVGYRSQVWCVVDPAVWSPSTRPLIRRCQLNNCWSFLPTSARKIRHQKHR